MAVQCRQGGVAAMMQGSLAVGARGAPNDVSGGTWVCVHRVNSTNPLGSDGQPGHVCVRCVNSTNPGGGEGAPAFVCPTRQFNESGRKRGAARRIWAPGKAQE